MRYITGFAIALLLTNVVHAQSPTDAEIAAAMAECATHTAIKIKREPSGKFPDVGGVFRREMGWAQGWEHCKVVQDEQSARTEQQKNAPAAVSKDVAAKLVTKP